MPHFFLKLIPPRPTFAADMNETEKAAMGRHFEYLKGLAEKGVGIGFGPVMDPKGAWGLGIVEVADEPEALEITRNDPVILAAIGCRYEVVPMRLGIMRKGLG